LGRGPAPDIIELDFHSGSSVASKAGLVRACRDRQLAVRPPQHSVPVIVGGEEATVRFGGVATCGVLSVVAGVVTVRGCWHSFFSG
jgi:hypothetical protein